MNRVHKQCPKIDSGTVLSQTGSKQAECTECTACWPAARPGRAPSACAARASRARAPVAARASCTRLPTRAPRTRLPTRLQPACAQPSACDPLLRASRAPRYVAALCHDIVQQPTVPAVTIQFLYCDTNFPQPAFLP